MVFLANAVAVISSPKKGFPNARFDLHQGAFRQPVRYWANGTLSADVTSSRTSIIRNKIHTMSQSASETTPDSAVFDVRAIPGRVKHAQIFQRWSDLQVGQFFILLNDHDPVPLRYQFEAEFANAYSWDYLERGPEEFRVKITKLQSTAPASFAAPARPSAPAVSSAPSPAAGTVNNVQEIDVRGFEPPEPLVRILDALESLPAGFTLRATTDREPCHLFGEAEQRGFRHDCHEQPDGSWITALTRA